MANRARITNTLEGYRGTAEKQRRKEAKAYLKVGSITDYQPVTLDDAGLVIYGVILKSIPQERLAEVDGYTVERAAANFSDVQAIEQLIASIGLNEAIQDGKLWNAKHKAEEQARKWLIELGCSPSARAKIAGDIAAKTAWPKTIRELLEESDDVDTVKNS